MIFIRRPQIDPFFNVAAEEFLLKNRADDLLMLWQNTPSVVVGKHQNVVAEVNLDFVRKNRIPVIRRISGGGTVYHDTGNINLSVITTVKKGNSPVDFRKFTRPVLAFVQQFGLEASFEGKNNLVINGKKFSGNSAHVFKNRVLHHGTLLYQTDLRRLEQIMHPDNGAITDKSVKSIRATVENLSEHLKNPPPLSVFFHQLKNHLKNHYAVTEETELTPEEQKAIEKLATEKYKSWQWNMGYSPKYTLRQQRRTPYGIFDVMLTVEEGHIAQLSLIYEGKRLEKIEQKLHGLKHDKEELERALSDNAFSQTIIQTIF
jgi:lipoate-protein ligase A